MNKDKCRHCRSTKRTIQARRLCSRCYLMPEVRSKYGKLKTLPPPPQPEPTEADLEAMIAEQMANLPDWWEAAAEVEAPVKKQPRVQVKLTASAVRQIRERAASGESNRSIARGLRISLANVCLIVRRETWKDVA